MRFRLRDSAGSQAAVAESTEFQPTPAELTWWAEARRPFRRRIMAVQAALIASLIAVPVLFGDTAGFLAGRWMVVVPVGICLAAGSAWLSWRLQERQMRPRYILGKRIRDEMLGQEATVDESTAAPDGRQAYTE